VQAEDVMGWFHKKHKWKGLKQLTIF
jgi:hypothetical protein